MGMKVNFKEFLLEEIFKELSDEASVRKQVLRNKHRLLWKDSTTLRCSVRRRLFMEGKLVDPTFTMENN